MDALEREVGAQLLDRTYRGMSLTEAGEAFVVAAREALSVLANGAKRARELELARNYTARLAYIPSQVYVDDAFTYINGFRTVYPDSSVLMEKVENPSDLVDYRLAIGPVDTASLGFEAHHLANIPVYCLLPKALSQATSWTERVTDKTGAAEVKLADLDDLQLMVPDRRMCARCSGGLLDYLDARYGVTFCGVEDSVDAYTRHYALEGTAGIYIGRNPAFDDYFLQLPLHECFFNYMIFAREGLNIGDQRLLDYTLEHYGQRARR